MQETREDRHQVRVRKKTGSAVNFLQGDKGLHYNSVVVLNFTLMSNVWGFFLPLT